MNSDTAPRGAESSILVQLLCLCSHCRYLGSILDDDPTSILNPGVLGDRGSEWW